MTSLWSASSQMPSFEPLRDNIKTDVLIIGGGMAGLLCARLLHDSGVDYALLEADSICGGVTCRTTAKITALHGLRCEKLMYRFGVEKTRQYYLANLNAIERYAQMCRDVDCAFERRDAYIYSAVGNRSIERECKALNRIGIDADVVKCRELPFGATAVRMRDQAQFDPLRFASAIARGLRIYDHTPVRSLRGCTACTDSGEVQAKRIIIATHFPFVNRHGSYFLKLYQERSYVIALENALKIKGMYLDDRPAGLSFRMHGDLLLVGGQNGRTGSKSGGWRALEDISKRLFPHSRVRYRWATQDCMTLDGIPYIGHYSALTPEWYVATGFNKWGMTSSMVAAELLTELVSGREKACTSVFSPSRSIIRTQLAVNFGHAVKELLTPTSPRCPHMGCALQWNAAERTWDCPCHGSRFDRHGKLLENPSQKDMSPPIDIQ